MTPTSVGLVLVEGNESDGTTVEHEAFEISSSDDAAAAIMRSEAFAVNRGLRLKSIGVTWSEDVGREASMLMRTLSESGFDNIVPVALPEATEALARGIADALGYRTTAVCAVEPDTVIALIVHSMEFADGAVHTAFNHSIDSDESLISWLSAVFTRADWQPEALVVVGSAGDFGEVMPRLQDALSVPVFSPVEAELALARGAALASAHTAEFELPEPYDFGDVLGSDYWGETTTAHGAAVSHRSGTSLRRRPGALPLAMLITGSATFVASVSMAVTMQFMPVRHIQAVPAALTVQSRPQPVVAPPPIVNPTVPAVTVVPPASVTEAPVEAPVVDQAPVVEQAPAPEGAPVEVAPPADDQPPAAAPVEAAPPPPPPPAPAGDVPVPADNAAAIAPATDPEPEHKTWRSRIKDRLHGVTEP